MKKGVSGQGKAAEKVLVDCGIPMDVIREQWALQKAAQLSLRARKQVDETIHSQIDKFSFRCPC